MPKWYSAHNQQFYTDIAEVGDTWAEKKEYEVKIKNKAAPIHPKEDAE